MRISSQLAQADKDINMQEVDYVSSVLSDNPKLFALTKSLFISACEKRFNFEIDALKIHYFYKNNRILHIQTIDYLCKLALIDGYMNKYESEIINRIIEILQIKDFSIKDSLSEILLSERKRFERLVYTKKKLNKIEFERSYKLVAKNYHPDLLYSLPDISKEYISCVTDHFIKINDIYNERKNKS